MEAGEFLVRGPQRALGYLDPQHTRDGFDDDGWFRTGDLGAIDARGCVTITGRTKDIINRGGEKLSAQEIEELICRHPGIGDAAVVAAPNDRLGEEPAAFIIERADAPTTEELQAFMRAEGWRRRRSRGSGCRWHEFPRTPSGKVKKYDLVEHLPPQGLSRRSTVGPAVAELRVALLAERGDALVDVVAQVQQAAQHGAVLERLLEREVAMVAQHLLDHLQRDLRELAHALRGAPW